MLLYSGLYFIPGPGNSPEASTNTINAIVNSIESHFEDASTRQNQWTLLHRLLRSIPNPSNTAAQPLSYHHILHLSYLSQGKTYCYIQPFSPSQSAQNPNVKQEPTSKIKAEPTSQAGTPQPSQSSVSTPSSSGSVISIPAPQSESHTNVLINQLGALWSLRQALHISGGVTYSVGYHTIHIGELRTSRSSASSGSNTISPGIVVCINTPCGGSDEASSFDKSGFEPVNDAIKEDGDEDVDYGDAQETIRELWDTIKEGLDLGKSEIKEVMMGKEGLNDATEKEFAVRMWCEVLRLRG